MDSAQPHQPRGGCDASIYRDMLENAHGCLWKPTLAFLNDVLGSLPSVRFTYNTSASQCTLCVWVVIQLASLSLQLMAVVQTNESI